MVLVDDHLTLLVVTGVLEPGQVGDDVATTSLWYLRLVAAATAPPRPVGGPGQLRRLLDEVPDRGRDAAMARILDPPSDLIEVLHPMRFAVEMARMHRERKVNLLGAEMLGAAEHCGASILVAAPNAGGPIEQAASEEGIRYEVRRA